VLVLFKIVPLAPTAKHGEVDLHTTPSSAFVVPDERVAHDEPPLVVVKTVPPLPTTMQVEADGQVTLHKLAVTPED
jgi:hypothetical protein